MSRVLVAFVLLLTLAFARLHAEEPQRGGKTIVGTVRDSAGKPVAGADVWLVTMELWFGKTREQVVTKTAEDGRFEFTVPEEWLNGFPQLRQELGVVAYRDDFSLGAISLYRESALPAGPIEIVLPPTESASLTVVDPDGNPLAGAKVLVTSVLCDSIQAGASASRVRQVANAGGTEPRTASGLAVVSRMPILLPTAVEGRLSSITDSDGRATITGVTINQLAGVSVEAKTYGRQRVVRSTYGTTDENPLVRLKVGRLIPVSGQLLGEPLDVADRPLRIFGYGVPESKTQVSIQIHSDVQTDKQGRFTAAVCEGYLYPFFDWDAGSPVRPVPPEQFQVKPGAKNHLEIPLQPAVKSYGYVKDVATGRGLSGVRVALFNSAWRGRPLTTDANGRYEATLAPGMAMVQAAIAPGYLPAGEHRQNQPQTISAGSPELKPILLQKGAVVAGSVVNDAGRPVAGVRVTANWYGYDPSLQHPDLIEETQTTDADGRYEFRGIDPTSECRVWAGLEGAFSRGVSVVKGDRSALMLNLSPKNAVRLNGRVSTAGGKPASGARLEIWQRAWMPAGNEPKSERVALAAGTILATDDDGRFVSPPLAPAAAYRISLVDSRFEPAHSAWADASHGKELPPAELLARTLGEHLGIVRDSAGKPVAGALVEFRGGLTRVSSRTDAEGKFGLKPAPDGPGLLFVAEPGYWFHGQRIEALGEPLDVRLSSVGKPYGHQLQPAPPPLSQAERMKLAQQLFGELIKAADSDLTGDTQLRVLQKWADVNPAAAIEFVSKNPSLLARNKDAVRFEAANMLLHTAPDDALDLIESMSSGHMPVLLYVRLASALPKDSPQRKLNLLAEAHLKAQAIREPGFRLVAVAEIAEGLLDLGQKERGTKLLADNLETARKLNRSGFDAYLRGCFAEELSQVDLNAALALVNDITDYFEKTRHLANIAQEMAGTRPAEAEEILADFPSPPEGSRLLNQKDHYVVRVCYRMASVDLARAKRLVASMTDPFHQAHARGVMAVALAKSDSHQSRELMRLAFDALDAAAAKKRSDLPLSTGNVGNIGGWLVLNSQQIDPELAAESRWRLLRLLPEVASSDPQQRWTDVEALSSAALFLAEIDAPLARELLTRLDGDWQLSIVGSSRTWLPAWGLVDPAEALRHASEISDERSRLCAKITLLSAIAATGVARERLLHYQSGMWRIDVEDIDQ
jgi:protocatechuate 3,4-dioxygenase beta subunit